MSTADPSTIPPFETTLLSAEATDAFAARFAKALAAGDRLLLRGDLGAGKTTFVRGLVRGLDAPSVDEVASPTFALHHRYPGGRLVVDHCDLYRLPSGTDLAVEGLDDVLHDRTNVLCVEWPERLALPPRGLAFELELRHAGESTRRARLLPKTEDAARRLKAALG